MDDINDAFLRFWNSLGQKSNSVVRVFDRGDYYTVHFDDAELLARGFFKSPETLKYFRAGSASCPYINIGKSNSDGVFKYLLIANQYRVEIYRSPGRQSESQWVLDFAATPGNLEKYQDILFHDADIASCNTLMALNIKRINDDYRIFLGFCDLDNGLFMLGSFAESYTGCDQLANLSSALFQLNCRECLVPANDSRPELSAVKDTVTKCGLLLTEVDKSKFSSGNICDSIATLISRAQFNSGSMIQQVRDSEGPEAVGCLGATVRHLELLTDDSFAHSFDVHTFKLNNFMRIGDQCGRALNLFPGPSDVRKCDSLYGLLNCCRTSGGERVLMQWLKQPLMRSDLINTRLDVVESLVNDCAIRSTLYDNYLRRVPDLNRLIRRIQRNKGSLQDLYKIYTALSQTIEIMNLLNGHEGPHKSVIESEFCVVLKEILDFNNSFMEMFVSIFDFNALQHHDYRVKSDVDENLKECEIGMNSVQEKIESEFSKVISKLGIESQKQVKLESSNSLGYYMRISRKDENILRNKNDIIILETLKDGVKFHSIKMASLNEEYNHHKSDYRQYEKSIVEELMKVTNDYASSIHQLSSHLAKLDVLCSLAVTVCAAPNVYTRPKIVESDQMTLKLKNCRHPLVEMQSNVSYIPNDVLFNEDRNFHIITGPNMGGKSTYIRSIGLICVMAQIGSFVPCDDSEISLRDMIMTRIGTGDSQLTGVSTFMTEMLDISWILKCATSQSLIIIDELGRGTSTFDGFGLAWSISEYLATELKAHSVFATHFHELTDLEKKHSNVKNLHVSASTIGNDLVFLYKVEEGACLKSYGIEVAKSAGLPSDVIEEARKKLVEYESVRELDNIEIDKLEQMRTDLCDFCQRDLNDVDNLDRFIEELRQKIFP